MPFAPPVSKRPAPVDRGSAPADRRRPPAVVPPARSASARVVSVSPASARPASAGRAQGVQDKPEPEILFQKFFKSVGPRTYAAQVKRANNGNHFLVLTEGRRDEVTGEVRKTRLMVFSEDFSAMFRMLHETAQFIKANPVPEEVRKKRERFWAKKAGEDAGTNGSSKGSRPQH